jgi:4-hydroxybenzoate polyprenyltransferase
LNGLIRWLFFGNYFYGFCAVALSIEAGLQQRVPLNSFGYYCIVFAATVLYYTHAYIAEPATQSGNLRSVWYSDNRKAVMASQILLTLLLAVAAICWLRVHGKAIFQWHIWQWLAILIIPMVAALYYGSTSPGTTTHNLRNQGWLKPFVIGFVWAGAVTVYPVILGDAERAGTFVPSITMLLLFIKNLMYITMLCIMFDIKDYAADHNKELKTFVVQYGLRKTIFFILIPLSALGLGTFLIFAVSNDFPWLRIACNFIPFVLLIIVAYSMYRRKSILYYLAIIDGLMMAKAICGILGMILIK